MMDRKKKQLVAARPCSNLSSFESCSDADFSMRINPISSRIVVNVNHKRMMVFGILVE